MRIVITIFFSFLAVSCATTTSHNLSALLYVDQPSVSTYSDPGVDFAQYTTFTVLPSTEVTGEPSKIANEIEAKQLLFFLRNQVESRGYRYVEAGESPDLIFTIDGDSEFRQTYIPPKNVVVPRWVPGQTSYSTGMHTGTFSGTSYGTGGNVYSYGNYSGTSSTTTTSSGYMTTDVVTQPGYNVGYWYPALAVAAYDASSGENVYLASGAATSKHADLRVSSQLLTMNLLKDLPVSNANVEEVYGDNQGRIGAYMVVATIDGNNYYPTVIRFGDSSAAQSAGVKVHDLITSINGESTRNMTQSNVIKRVIGAPGSTVTLGIWRMGTAREYVVKRR